MILPSNPVVLFLYRWSPPFLVMLVIFLFSMQSDLPGAGVRIVWWDFVAKKTAHLIEYAALFYCWTRALHWNTPWNNRAYWPVLMIILFYAISDEIHQSFTPTRHPSPRDIGFDMLGGFLVYLKQKGFV